MTVNYKNLFTAFAKAQLEFEPVCKVKEGYNYKYADLNEVRRSAIDALSSNGISIIQFPINDGDNIGVETILGHTSGEHIGRTFTTPIKKMDPQDVGTVLTYYRRYSLLACLGLAPQDDTDAEDHRAVPRIEIDTETNPGDYEMAVGFKGVKGVKLKDLDMEIVKDQYSYWSQNAKTGKAKEAVAALKNYLDDRNIDPS